MALPFCCRLWPDLMLRPLRRRAAGSPAGGKGVGKRSCAEVDSRKRSGGTEWYGGGKVSERRVECDVCNKARHTKASEAAQSTRAQDKRHDVERESEEAALSRLTSRVPY